MLLYVCLRMFNFKVILWVTYSLFSMAGYFVLFSGSLCMSNLLDSFLDRGCFYSIKHCRIRSFKARMFYNKCYYKQPHHSIVCILTPHFSCRFYMALSLFYGQFAAVSGCDVER